MMDKVPIISHLCSSSEDASRFLTMERINELHAQSGAHVELLCYAQIPNSDQIPQDQQSNSTAESIILTVYSVATACHMQKNKN